MSKHTSGDWYVNGIAVDVRILAEVSGAKEDILIAVLGDERADERFGEVKANAEYIVKAANNHKPLVEALRGLLRESIAVVGRKDVKKHFHFLVQEAAASALLAEIETSQ
jgi:hypothetical protein